jgi:plastocyanin
MCAGHRKRELTMIRPLFAVIATTLLNLVAAPITASPHPTTAIVKMDLNMKPSSTKYGELGGYDPRILTVHVGDKVVWENVNPETHTATSHLFPTDGRITTGTTIGPTPWSTGDVASGHKSRGFVAAKPGVYRYSCGYHVKLGQRGIIVVLPSS